MELWICSTCAVESAELTRVCAICADERQWVPATGQQWTTLEELNRSGYRADLTELEPDLFGISSHQSVGIGQQPKLLRTDTGNLLGSDRLYRSGHRRPRAAAWAGARDCREPPAHVRRPGGVKPRARRRGGAGGRGGCRVGASTGPGDHDLVRRPAAASGGHTDPARRALPRLRSFPDRLPLSGTVVERIVRHVDRFEFDRSMATSTTWWPPTRSGPCETRRIATSAGSAVSSTTSPRSSHG